jgi:hypothetical protein
MRNVLKALLLLLIFSCSTSKKKEEALSEWKGKPSSDLYSHPYFGTLPHEKITHKNGPDTWIFKDQSKYQTDAYCSSLGGCIGLPTYNCLNSFSIEKGKIIGVQQDGSCPGESTIKYKK